MSRKGILLCYPFEEKRLKTWPAAIVQPKLDGDRCRAIFDGSGNVTLLTSEENEVTSVPHIKYALEKLHLTHVELDGELYTHGMLHQDIRSIVGRTRNLSADFTSMQYHVFDMVNQEFQLQRLKDVKELLSNAGPEIEVVQFELAHNVEQIMQLMTDYNEMGYEGVIVRHPFGQYVRKRSTQIMKYKPKKSDIYPIVDVVQEISIEGHPKPMVGAVWCTSNEGTRFKVSCSSTTHENKRKWWEERDNLIGKYLVVHYQNIHPSGSPRFGRSDLSLDIVKEDF